MKNRIAMQIVIAAAAASTLLAFLPAPVCAAASSDPAAIVDNAQSALAAAVSDSTDADNAAKAAKTEETSNTDAAKSVVTIHLQTEDDLREAAKACSLDTYSQDKLYVLDNDIALEDGDLQFAAFGGTFDGQGYKITGLRITGKVSDAGLFRQIQEGGVVKNLSVSGTISVTGTQENAGGIAGTNNGMIRSCSFTGTVKGKNRVGGIAGSNGTTGVLDNCSSKGDLQGSTASGGLVGSNAGIIRNAASGMQVNIQYTDTTASVEDISSTLENILMSGDVNSVENFSAVTDTGGIAGFNSGEILYCENSGTVGYEHVGYNTGGIAGRSSGLVRGCANSGRILGRKDVGGIIGQQQPYLSVEFSEDDLQKISDDLDDISDLSDSLLNDASSLTGTASASASNLTSLTREAKSSIQTITDEAQKDVNHAANDLQVTQNTLKNVNGLASALSSQASTYADSLSASLRNMESAFDAAVANAQITQAEKDSLRQAFQNLQSAAAALDTEAGAVSSAINSTSGTAADRAKALSSAIVSLQDAADKVIDGYQDLQKKIRDLLGKDLDDLSDNAAENAREAASTAEEAAAEAGSAAEEAAGSASSTTEEAADTADSAAESGDVTADTNPDIQSLVDSIQKNIADQADSVRNAVDNAASSDGSSVTDSNQQLQNQLERFLSDQGLSKETLEQLKELIQNADLDDETKKELLSQLDAISSRIDDLKASAEKVKTAIAGIEKDASTFKDNSAVIRTNVQKMLDDFDTIRSGANSISSTLETYADRIPDYSTSNLKDAVDAMVSAITNAPDFDAIIQNILTALDGISFSFDGVSGAVSQASSSLYSNLESILSEIDSLNSSISKTANASVETLRQINAKARSIADTCEDLYKSATSSSDPKNIADTSDISDEDLESYTTGRTTACTNTGTIEADNDVGGIVGTMGVEYDLDPERDIQTVGSDSIDYSFLARAIVDSCTNLGEVDGKNNYTGGVVGHVSIGLVTKSGNSGAVTGTDYVGGTAGYSVGILRNSYAKCDLTGEKYVGGIAGYATTLTGCTSMVNVLKSTQYVGAIAGTVRELDKEKISGNEFVSDTLQGIDSTSYTGIAEPVTYEAVMARTAVPKAFRQMVLTFKADDTVIRTVKISYGGSLAATQIPAVPEKDGFYGIWSRTDFTGITADEVVTADYERIVTLLPADRQRDHVTILFAEGNFQQDDTMHIASEETAADEAERWSVTLPDDGSTSHTFRYLAPDGAANVPLYLVDTKTGKRTALETGTMGEYLTFTAAGTSFTFSCGKAAGIGLSKKTAAAAGGAALLVLLLLLLRRRRKKKRRAAAASKEETAGTAEKDTKQTENESPEEGGKAPDPEENKD